MFGLKERRRKGKYFRGVISLSKFGFLELERSCWEEIGNGIREVFIFLFI